MAHLTLAESSKSNRPLSRNRPTFTEEGLVVLMLNENGLIMHCNETATKRFSCTSDQLRWQPVSNLLPHLAGTILMQGGVINPRLRFLSRIGHLFEVSPPNGEMFRSRVFFNEIDNDGRKSMCFVICPEAGIIPPARDHYQSN